MEPIVKEILASAIPPGESLKSSDFFGAVKSLQDKITEVFRYTSLNQVPTFISLTIQTIEENVKSSDKRRKFAAAVSITSMMTLFPFDDYISQYRPTVERLLIPGYKPLIHIGALVLGRLVKISGRHKDVLVRELIEINRKRLIDPSNVDARYAAAVIWNELSSSAPEHFFQDNTDLLKTVLDTISLGDRSICEIVIQAIGKLFSSEGASVGHTKLSREHNLFKLSLMRSLPELKSPDSICINFQLLNVLLEIKPYESTESAQNLVPTCIRNIESKYIDVAYIAIETLCVLKKTSNIAITMDQFNAITRKLFNWGKADPQKVEKKFSKYISAFIDGFSRVLPSFIRELDVFLKYAVADDGPHFALLITQTMIKSLPSSAKTEISQLLNNIIRITAHSKVPLPINKLLVSLNKTHQQWGTDYSYFRYQMIQTVRQHLTNPTIRTTYTLIALHSLNEIDNITFSDAIEFGSLIIKLKKSKDIEIREMIANSIIQLFEDYPDQIPLASIKKLVKFALDDPARSVRIKSLKAFTPITYRYLSQPDVFSVFANFIFDENTDVRKHALYIIRNLPIFTKSVIRNALLKALKQTSLNYSSVIAETAPSWIMFPNLIQASGPMLHIYADSLYNKFYKMLIQRFEQPEFKERSLIYMNSAIMLTIDESLIKSLTKLHMMCPEVVPVEPIVKLFSKILLVPVHPWTKEQSLKSLKNLVSNGVAINKVPELIPALVQIVRDNISSKLVTKTLKVIGAIGCPDIPVAVRKTTIVYRSSLTNRGQFNTFFITHYFNYLVERFESINLESTRESVARCISKLFIYRPDMAPSFVPKFMDQFLTFIKNTTSTNLPCFFNYLATIIDFSKHLITPYVERIFQALEDHWHDNYTKEASVVLSTLVISTQGRCDSILHLLVSVSFLLLKTKKDADEVANDLFNLLRVIAQYSRNYLTPVVTGVITILHNPNSSVGQMEQSLATLYFILSFCTNSQHISAIRRCLGTLAARTQSRWRDDALNILRMMDTADQEVTLQKFDFIPHPPLPEVGEFKFTVLIDLMVPPLEQNRYSEYILDAARIESWFAELRRFIIEESPSLAVRTMSFLPVLPKFAFHFAFLCVWFHVGDFEKKELSNRLNDLFARGGWPDSIISQFISLVEFATLCEVRLGVDVDDLVLRCNEGRFYTKALFFLEEEFAFHPDARPDDTEVEQIAHLNVLVGRQTEARAIANARETEVGYKTWMELGDWERALEAINEQRNPPITDKVPTLAMLEDWEGIISMENDFEKKDVLKKAGIARYFWMAEMLTNSSQEKVIHFMDQTGGFTANDCIYKAIAFTKFGDYDMAQECVHLGWRYLSASVTSLEKHNRTLIHRHLFQAEQLHEMSDVLDMLRKGKDADEFTRMWRERLKLLKDFPQRQIELYKIRSLVSHIIDLDNFAFHVLSCNDHIFRNKSDSERLIRLFFKDAESAAAKYSTIKLRSEDRISDLKELLKSAPEKMRPRIINQIGKEKLRRAVTIDDLRASLEDLREADMNNKKIADVLVSLSYLTKEPQMAIDAAEEITKCITQKSQRHIMHINQLLSLLIAFSGDESVVKNIGNLLMKMKPNYFSHSLTVIIALLNHPKPGVVSVAKSISSNLCREAPQIFAFDLLTASEKYPDSELFEDLVNILSLEHPVYHAQMEMIRTKLVKFSYTIFDVFNEKLAAAFDAAVNKDLRKAQLEIRSLLPLLNANFGNAYESKFKGAIPEQKKEFMRKFCEQSSLKDEDIAEIERIGKLVLNRQDAIRVIPLKSLDEQLDKKTKWSLNILGKHNANVTIARFHHSVQRWKNGLRITLLSSDGQKYNFHLKRNNNNYLEEAVQFMALLNSITPVIRIHQRSVVQISLNVQMLEILKGYMSIFDLVAIYKQTKNQQADKDIISTTRHFESCSYEERVREIAEHAQSDSRFDLARAILVTSKNASTFLQRQSSFAKSLGALSALSFILGAVSTTPTDILFEKGSGFTTYTSFTCAGHSLDVPFRLTPMVRASFGTAGVSGPFMTALVDALAQVQHHRLSIASSIQFVLGKKPFEECVLPSQYLEKFAPTSAPEDIDLVYGRISGDGTPVEEEAAHLIEEASSINNIAKMPATWIPWW